MNRFRLRPVCIFIALSFGMAWLVALPLWLDRGVRHPLFMVFILVRCYWNADGAPSHI